MRIPAAIRASLRLALVLLSGAVAAGAAAGSSRLSFDAGYTGCIFRQSDVRNSIDLLNLYTAVGEDEDKRKVGIFLGEGYRVRGGIRAWGDLHLVCSYGGQKGRKRERGMMVFNIYGTRYPYDYDVNYLGRIDHLGFGLRYERAVLGWFSTYFEGLAGPARMELRRVLQGEIFDTMPGDQTYAATRLAYELRYGLKLYVWKGSYLEADAGYRYALSGEIEDGNGTPAWQYDSFFQQSREPLAVNFSGLLFTFRAGWELF